MIAEQDWAATVASLTCTVSVGAWLLYTRGYRRRLVSPFSMLLLLLFSIFGVRPLLMLEEMEFELYGMDVASGFIEASVVGLLATVSCVVGYFVASWRQHRGTSEIEVVQRESLRPGWTALLLGSIGLMAAWYLLMVSYGGWHFLAVLFDGRSRAVDRLYSTMPVFIPAIPVAAAASIAYGRIVHERTEAFGPVRRLQFWSVIVLAAMPSLGVGNRRFIIPVLLCGVMGSWFQTGSLRLRPIAAVAGALAFFAFAVIPFVRSAGSRGESSDIADAALNFSAEAGVWGVLNNFFLSYDTEMFNYIAYLAPRLGDRLSYGYGRGTVVEALLAALPARSLPVETWSNTLLTEAFGGGCAVTKICPVPSVTGVLLYDFGLFGVLAGMWGIGYLCWRFDTRAYYASRFKLIVYLVLGASAPAIWRGNSISQLWIAGNVVLICIAFVWLCERLRGIPSRK